MSNEQRSESGMSADARVFLGAVILGFVLMVVLKRLVFPQLLVTGILVGVVIGYSVLVVRLPRLRLRMDQAGDNAYYLGLIFTLLSMGFALYTIGVRLQSPPEQGSFSVAETVIGDFGIALGTTLAGIICRILLHQMRVDPTDVEEQSRIQLAQAASSMVAQLNNLSAGFGEFILKLQQKQQDHADEMAEIHKEMRSTFEESVSQSVSRSVTLLETTAGRIHVSITEFTKVADSLTQALKEASNRLGAVEPPPTKLSKQFTLLANKLESISETLSGTSTQLEGNFDRIHSITDEIESIVKEVSGVAPTLKERLNRHDAEFADVMALTKKEVSELQTTVVALKDTTTKLEADASRSTEAIGAAESSAIEVLDRLTKVVERVSTIIEQPQAQVDERAQEQQL